MMSIKQSIRGWSGAVSLLAVMMGASHHATAQVVDLYWTSIAGTSSGHVYRAVAGTHEPELLITTPYEGRPMMVETYRRWVYWTTYYPGQLWRANRDGSDPGLLIDQGYTTTRAIRFMGENIYWCNEDLGELYRAHIDGGTIATVLSGYTGRQSGIWDFDIYDGRIYWVSWQSDKVKTTALDGSDFQSFTIEGSSRIFNIEVEDDALFLNDNRPDESVLLRTNLDGSNPMVLAGSVFDTCDTIATLDDRLYYGWYDATMPAVHIDSMRFDGSEVREELFVEESIQLWQISVAHRLGDLDEDGAIGFSDLLALLLQWGPCSRCSADLDGDGLVGLSDLLLVLLNWTA